MYQSPTHGPVAFADIRSYILAFLKTSRESQYQIVIGTDSQPHNGEGVDFITAIVVHRIGSGGIYFWKRVVNKKRYVLRQRMYEEAMFSLAAAEELVSLLYKDGIRKFDVEIHVDIGEHGKTREMIAEIVGMVRGNGFPVKIKPDSYAASSIADRYA